MSRDGPLSYGTTRMNPWRIWDDTVAYFAGRPVRSSACSTTIQQPFGVVFSQDLERLPYTPRSQLAWPILSEQFHGVRHACGRVIPQHSYDKSMRCVRSQHFRHIEHPRTHVGVGRIDGPLADELAVKPFTTCFMDRAETQQDPIARRSLRCVKLDRVPTGPAVIGETLYRPGLIDAQFRPVVIRFGGKPTRHLSFVAWVNPKVPDDRQYRQLFCLLRIVRSIGKMLNLVVQRAGAAAEIGQSTLFRVAHRNQQRCG